MKPSTVGLSIFLCSQLILTACKGQDPDPETPNSSVGSSQSSSTATVLTVFEEEQAGYCSVDGNVEWSSTGFTGTGYVNGENRVGAQITWHIDAGEAGRHYAEFRFGNAGGSSRVATVYINGDRNGILNFDSVESWTDWQTEGLELYLEAGTNVVTLEADTEFGLPNIDHLSLAGNGVEPAPCNISTSSSSSTSSTSSLSSQTSSSSSSLASGVNCSAYDFPEYSPDLDYDFRDEFADIDPSTFQVYKGCRDDQIAGIKTMGWFAFIWGPNRNPKITDEHIDRMLRELNEDAAYARDQMGWPPDRLPQEGYFSNVYLFGSGLCTDNASPEDLGGWQSGIQGYPMVLLSWYPIVNGDRGGITHEYIHTIMATFGNKVAWFNEGGNTWLQMNMEADRTGQYGVGFLDAGPFLAPHMPIENYSGWLQDGSFGGPDAQGVNRQGSNGQISTWRRYLGGNQYNSVFSHFLAEHVSKGANAWLWANKDHRQVLLALESGLGEEQVRHLIMEYRARQALVDFGPWENAFKRVINGNWGQFIGAEDVTPGGIWVEPPPYQLSFYAKSTTNGNTVTPDPETLPGWSGANQIPLNVNGDKVRVAFEPLGANMRMQLVYKAADGSNIYSKPVENGEACLDLDKAPRNGSVVAVISNTDYRYENDQTRQRKYDYRLKLLEGVSSTASTTSKHYE